MKNHYCIVCRNRQCPFWWHLPLAVIVLLAVTAVATNLAK